MLVSRISGTVAMPEALVLTCTSTVQCLPFHAFCSGIKVWLLLGQSIAYTTMHIKAAAKSNMTGDMTNELLRGSQKGLGEG
jgi:hypothetical protein